MAQQGTAIDTGKVQGRRALRFHSLDEALADAEKLVAADRAGKLQQLGNWTLGQALGHIAAWIGFGFDGSPLNPPWFIKMIVRLKKKQFISGSMPVGVKIPRVEGGTVATEVLSTEEGLSRFRTAVERLQRDCPARPNVIFGPLTHEQWIGLNLRHCELHLSFFVPS